MKLFLTEVHGGRAMLTHREPVLKLIDYTSILDAFPLYGEPIDVRHLCQNGIRGAISSRHTGLVLRPLTPTLVRLSIQVLDRNQLITLEEYAKTKAH